MNSNSMITPEIQALVKELETQRDEAISAVSFRDAYIRVATRAAQHSMALAQVKDEVEALRAVVNEIPRKEDDAE